MPVHAADERQRPLGASAGLHLLFRRGDRPDAAAVAAALERHGTIRISHDPGRAGQHRTVARDWLELVADGLTYDLLGLVPGPGLVVPDIVHRLGLAADFPGQDVEGVVLVPGPHLAEGASTLPVLRGMVAIASALSHSLPGVRAVGWSPARTAMARSTFLRLADDWIAGGAFPSLGLVGLIFGDDGWLRSDGLAFFTLQEIALGPDLAADRVAATRLAARLVHELVGTDRVRDEIRLVTAEGRELVLVPTPDERVVRVQSIG